MTDTATPQKDPSAFNDADNGRVRAIVDAIEALEKAKKDLADQISAAYKDAESEGYSRKRISDCVKKRKRRWKHTAAQLNAAQLEFDLYWSAAGGDDAAQAVTDAEDRRAVMDRGGRSFN